MKTLILLLCGLLFALGMILRIVLALFFPDRFAAGARKVLFLEERQEKLFQKKDTLPRKPSDYEAE